MFPQPWTCLCHDIDLLLNGANDVYSTRIKVVTVHHTRTLAVVRIPELRPPSTAKIYRLYIIIVDMENLFAISLPGHTEEVQVLLCTPMSFLSHEALFPTALTALGCPNRTCRGIRYTRTLTPFSNGTVRNLTPSFPPRELNSSSLIFDHLRIGCAVFTVA